MTVKVNGQEISLSGTVGADWFDDGFTHAEVVAALAGLDGDITVRLNSGGGIAAEGAAIYSTLSMYEGEVNILIEGIAASAASLLAMAGNTITMADGAVMMIHDPMNITIGNSDDHARMIEQLEAYATAYAKVYAKRSGKTADECRTIMKAETWLDGEAAIEAGFADAAGKSKAKTAAAYDYRVYACAPRRLVTQAKAKNWSITDYIPTETAASSAAQNKEAMMPTDKERADALAAELAAMKADLATATASAATATASVDAAVKADRDRRAAIMALDEAKGREPLAEHLFTTGSSIEQAKATLSVSPKAVVDDTAAQAAAYEATRLAGADLTNKQTDASKADNYGWAKAIARVNVGIVGNK